MAKRTLIAGLAGAIAAAGATFTWISGVHISSTIIASREADELSVFASRAVKQVELVRGQAIAALQAVQTIAGTPCTSEYLIALGQIAFSYRYVRDLGSYSERKYECSMLLGDVRQQTVNLPATEWSTSSGNEIWIAPNTGSKGAHRDFLVGRKGQFVSVDPTMFVDLIDTGQRNIAVLDIETGNLIAATLGANENRMRTAYLQRGAQPAGQQRYLVAESPALPLAVVVEATSEGSIMANSWVLIACLAISGATAALLGRIAYRLLSGRFSLLHALQSALQEQRIRIHYQPIVNIFDRSTVGVEALLRWRHEGRDISPAQFVELAEGHGLGQKLTDYVTITALTELTPILCRNREFYVSINVTAEALTGDHYLNFLVATCQRLCITPNQVRIEATERNLIAVEAGQDAITSFKTAGFSVYIDDFGTGYSGLSYLTQFEPNAIKIDKSFVEAITQSPLSSLVLPHIIVMAQALGLGLIAEGIECDAEAQYLREHGVRFGQGWLYSPAMPIGALEQHLYGNTPPP